MKLFLMIAITFNIININASCMEIMPTEEIPLSFRLSSGKRFNKNIEFCKVTGIISLPDLNRKVAEGLSEIQLSDEDKKRFKKFTVVAQGKIVNQITFIQQCRDCATIFVVPTIPLEEWVPETKFNVLEVPEIDNELDKIDSKKDVLIKIDQDYKVTLKKKRMNSGTFQQKITILLPAFLSSEKVKNLFAAIITFLKTFHFFPDNSTK